MHSRIRTTNSSMGDKCIATSAHQNFCFTRIVRLWNYLPAIGISLSIHLIKKQLLKFFWNKFNDVFNSDNLCTYHVLCPCYQCSSQPIITTKCIFGWSLVKISGIFNGTLHYKVRVKFKQVIAFNLRCVVWMAWWLIAWILV